MTDQEELTEIAKLELFTGTPSRFGGLSNERELSRYVPAEFKNHRNRWTDAAATMFYKGAKTSDWKWRTTDPHERTRQIACFRGLLLGWEMQHEQKLAIAGWMLSEMLTEVPK